MFDPAYPFSRIRPAAYNPRTIANDAIDVLRASIRTTGGLVKPIIVTSAGLTVAGHQRTKAAKAEGITTGPVFVLDVALNDADEIRFNQIHNGTDNEEICHMVTVPAGPVGWEDLPSSAIRCGGDVPGAALRAAICELIQRYGTWGGVVATESGRVLSAPQYALACRALLVPCRVCRVPDAIADKVAGYFLRQYGEFNYDHIERRTWAQTFAQPYRLRKGDKISRAASALYEGCVMPAIERHDRVIDFGCGQADYVHELARLGYNIHGIEFFYRGGTMNIDPVGAHKLIDAALAAYAEHGPFDVVVCDSVLNSVDSVQAETDVMVCLNALLKPGGRAFFSGRRTEDNDSRLRSTKRAGFVNRVEFLDANGLTASHSRGGWFFQKRHTAAQALALAHRFFGDAKARGYKHNSSCWQVACTKRIEQPAADVEAALRREFNLPWPVGTVGRANQAVAAWRTATGIVHAGDSSA